MEMLQAKPQTTIKKIVRLFGADDFCFAVFPFSLRFRLISLFSLSLASFLSLFP